MADAPAMSIHRKDWTPELDKQLTELHEQGLSFAKIGQVMGVTKGSVVGRVHRLGLPSRPNPRWDKAREKAEKKSVPLKHFVVKKLVVKAKAKSLPLPPTPRPASGALTLFELPPGLTRCRWPLGDGIPKWFCGAGTAEGHVYCDEHEKKSCQRYIPVSLRVGTAISPR